MKQAEQANPQGNAWIEHVFGAANGMSSTYESNRQVEAEQALKEQETARQRRENQRTFEPEAQRDEQIAEIA